MHDSMPYDPIRGQGQGHECLKTTQEESSRPSSLTGLISYLSLMYVWFTEMGTRVAIFTLRRSFAEYWKDFVARFNDVHASAITPPD